MFLKIIYLQHFLDMKFIYCKLLDIFAKYFNICNLYPYCMSKSSNEKIEEDKNKVIQQLMMDARQSPHEIAKKLGFSRQKAWKLIKELEKENTIWGYNVIVGEKEGERTTYFALTEKSVSKVDVRIKGTYYLNGTYDWITAFTAKNIIDAKIFCAYMQKEYGEYIERVDLLESVFPLIKCGKVNPELEQLRKFIIE